MTLLKSQDIQIETGALDLFLNGYHSEQPLEVGYLVCVLQRT